MKLTESEKELLTLSVFEGIEEDFEEYWVKRKEDWHKGEQDGAKKRVWKNLISWIRKWHKLDQAVIPERSTEIVECMVETRQQYKNFTAEDVVKTIGKLGELASHMYLAGRDVFPTNSVSEPREYCPLAQYYYLALEHVVWRIASFAQDNRSGGSSFIDLQTRLKTLFEVKNE